MRIAIVTPYVASVLGNRAAFAVARELAAAHEVTVYAHTVATRLVEEIRGIVAPATFVALRTREIPPPSMARLLWLQLRRGPDRTLAAALHRAHVVHPLDALFVFSDEGHWIGPYVRDWAPPRPVTVLEVLELIDHPFLLRRDRSAPAVRALAGALYPLLHRIEDARLRSFDALVTISHWTSTLLGYLYGLPARAEIVAYDDRTFAPGGPPAPGGGYLAVPTASLDARGTRWIERLHADGIPLRLYGPRAAGTVPSLGYLPAPAMVDLVRGANATVFLFDYEAFGLLPVESLALGTPVITSPEQGPLEEHRGSPGVRFVTSYPELREACQAALRNPPAPALRAACAAGVARYRPSAAAARFVAVVEEARRARG